MLPNLLIALGLVLAAAGVWLKFREQPEPAAVEVAQTTSATPEEKGRAFEEWVVHRLPQGLFALKDWRGDKVSAQGRYAESNGKPDFEVDLKLGPKRYPFAVEGKWRQGFRDGTLSFSDPEQLTRYRDYARETGRPVFLAIGLGGTPDAPAELFIVPLTDARTGTMNVSALKDYKQSMSRTAFYFDVVHSTLKY